MQSLPETAADRVIRKAARRFLWLLFLLFMFSFIDRANVGMAALTMNNDLGISASQFALSLTSFSVAYFLCEIPSNLILERVGARIWIARIAITWGLASAACMLIAGPISLIILRILVGIAEAGFAPGAVLYLTSGATGEPKMGVVSHAAIIANLDMAPTSFPIGPEDSTVVFLPSAHIAQRIVLELIPMRMGTPVYFAENLTRLAADLKVIRPTMFLAPPRVWERMYATITNELKKRPLIAQKLFHGALGLGLEAARLKQQGKPLPGWMKKALKLAEKLVFSKVKERLGGRLRIAASGAAPLGRDLAEFFSAIQMPLLEGYGLTEAGVITFNPLDAAKPGSIGKVLPGIQLRLAEDGELQVKTPCIFKGYYKDPVATATVIGPDGWFSTGDLAEVDEQGYWYITGRKKELIVSSNGKKIYPARIENLFKMEPLVSQVVLIGDKKPYVTALLTINMQQAQNIKGVTSETVITAEPVSKAVSEIIGRVNKQLADFERIRRFKVLERDLSIEQGELTPTMKIRRGRVLENHKELVSQLYLGREESE